MICLPQGIAFTAVPSKSIAIGGEHIVTVAVVCDLVVCGFYELFSVFYDFHSVHSCSYVHFVVRDMNV